MTIFGLTPQEIGLYTVEGVVCVLFASFVFDCIHFLLHACAASTSPLLRSVGALHDAHHRFVDTSLVHHPDMIVKNIVMHHIPEYLTQIAVCSAFYLVFHWLPVAVTQGILTVVFFIMVFVFKGKDPNHTPVPVVSAPLHNIWVVPSYHLLHHVYPRRFMGSYLTLFDRLFGTACPIAGRRFVITGARGSFGAPLAALLEKKGGVVVRLPFAGARRADATSAPDVVDWTYDDLSRVESALDSADVLVLAHGSKVEAAHEANCASFVAFVELFKKKTAGRRLPPEVWATGSEIEAHPAFGSKTLAIYRDSKRAYAAHAHRYWRDKSILYRHVVCSAFTSKMGPGLLSGKATARIALFLIERGFRYVAVTYTGIAFLNFFKFALPFNIAPAPPGSATRFPREPVLPGLASGTG